jgi:hypothetical protein
MNLRSVAPQRQDGTWVAQAQRIPKSPSVADFADKSKFFATFQVYATEYKTYISRNLLIDRFF